MNRLKMQIFCIWFLSKTSNIQSLWRRRTIWQTRLKRKFQWRRGSINISANTKNCEISSFAKNLPSRFKSLKLPIFEEKSQHNSINWFWPSLPMVKQHAWVTLKSRGKQSSWNSLLRCPISSSQKLWLKLWYLVTGYPPSYHNYCKCSIYWRYRSGNYSQN